jgi:chromosome partitioning protein
MAKIISIFILKGGTGKTFLTFTLGGFFAATKEHLGLSKKVLLIDCDPQGSLTRKFMPNADQIEADLSHFLDKTFTLKDCIYSVEEIKKADGNDKAHWYKNLSILPIRPNSLGFFTRVFEKNRKNILFRLKEELQAIQDTYDYILIDCTNQSEPAFYMALIASNYVIIPTTCDVEGLECYFYTKAQIDLIIKELNPGLKILGIGGNLYKETRAEEKWFALEGLPSHLAEDQHLFIEPVIKDMSGFKKSLNNKTPINFYESVKSPANILFKKFVQNVQKRMK